MFLALMLSEADMASDASEFEEESDLDLVKSLMADLADDPDGYDADEDLDALLAIPDVDEAPEAGLDGRLTLRMSLRL